MGSSITGNGLHGGDDHQLLMPRPEEAESWARLDRLSDLARNGTQQERCGLVAAHVGSLFARVESAPDVGRWPVGRSVDAGSPRWVEAVVGHEIDRLVLRLAESQPQCVDCLVAWVRHLVGARVVLAEWTWVRDAAGLLP